MSDPQEKQKHNDSRRRPGALFKALAVALALLPFVALEIGLRLFGVGADDGASDPFAGFGSNIPVFERDGDVWRMSDKRMPFLAEQSFPAKKAANGYRAFCFGGSTVHGRPYEAETAFPRWLEMELAATREDRTIEVVNCGGISYASYRIVPMLREVLRYEPDLIVVATGHNEFLEDRTYHSLKSRTAAQSWIDSLGQNIRTVRVGRNLLRGKREPSAAGNPEKDGDFETRLDTENGYASYHRDADWHARVVEQYEDSLRAMVELCAEAGVPLAFVRLGSNVRDCPPFKSEHRADLSSVDEAAWREAFDRGDEADKAGDLESALAAYRDAEKIDEAFALLHWRLARCLDRLGRKVEARTHYLRAKDEDICPLRIFERQAEFLVGLAEESGAPLIDARRRLEELSPDGIPGNDWYLDHVHPTIAGHQEIARLIAARLEEVGLLPVGRNWSDKERSEAFAAHFRELGPVYLGNGRRRLEWLETWAKRNLLEDETLPVDGGGHLRAGFRQLDFGERTKARRSIKTALEMEPELLAEIEARRELLVAQGRPSEVLDGFLTKASPARR